VRLFVALELPEVVRLELARWARVAVGSDRSWRVLEVENLHVTLCFLGGQDASEVAEIAAACASAASGVAAPGLSLGEAVWLPRRGPRVLGAAVSDASGGLAAVQDALSRALSSGGWYRPEKRGFLAHVTVARVRRGASVRRAEVDPPAPLSFDGHALTLFRSHLGPAGARYEALSTVALD
jgi:2'-5' RNA ligase